MGMDRVTLKHTLLMGWLYKKAVQVDSGAEVRWHGFMLMGVVSMKTLMMQEKWMQVVILMYIWRRDKWVPVNMAGTEKAESVGHYGEVQGWWVEG